MDVAENALVAHLGNICVGGLGIGASLDLDIEGATERDRRRKEDERMGLAIVVNFSRVCNRLDK